MAIVLSAVAAFVYLRLRGSLVAQVDLRLAARAEAIEAGLVRGDGQRALDGDRDEFAQLLSSDGRVRLATAGFETALLSAGQFAVARTRALSSDVRIALPDEHEHEPFRLLARPMGTEMIVVGASLEDATDALTGLLAQLAIGGPFALVLASGGAYLLAGAALRPVGAMRRRAAEISAETSGERLPLPPARDEIRRLGETLNAMLDRLDHALQRERRFVADASHELRTPLALLQTELELALRRPRSAADLDEALRSVTDEVERLARLADDLLLLATTDGARVSVTRAPIPLAELLGTVSRRFEARAAAAGRALTVVSSVDGRIDGDRLRLEQALGNLLDNALRHGGGQITLSATREDAGTLALTVSDEGDGFPADFLPHALERFSRADAARTRSGAGLGLAIVHAIARVHGGSVRVGNGDRKGAAVSIMVPGAER